MFHFIIEKILLLKKFIKELIAKSLLLLLTLIKWHLKTIIHNFYIETKKIIIIKKFFTERDEINIDDFKSKSNETP